MEGTSSKQQPKPTKQPEPNPPTNSISPATRSNSGVTPPDSEEIGSFQEHSDIERYRKVFKVYYARLCDVLPVEEILPHLVSNDVITLPEMDDVLAEKTSFRQTRALLNGPIWRAISGGCPQAFITLLCALRSVRIA